MSAIWYAAAVPAEALLIIAATPIITWRIGGPAERWGAILNALLSLVVMVAQIATHTARPPIAFLFGDFLLATGFLVLALRYSNIWLGVAMLLQSAELTLNAVTLSAGRQPSELDASPASWTPWSPISSASLWWRRFSAAPGRIGDARSGPCAMARRHRRPGSATLQNKLL